MAHREWSGCGLEPQPQALAALNSTLDDVVRGVGNSTSNPTGGFATQAGRELVVRNVGRTTDPTELAATPVGAFPGGVTIPLSAVADVTLGVAPKRGDAGID